MPECWERQAGLGGGSVRLRSRRRMAVHERLDRDRANSMRQLGLLPALASAATTPPVTFS